MKQPKRTFHVLSIEDSVGDQRLIHQHFRDKCELHFVNDGEEGLNFLLRRGTYSDAPRADLVLLDLSLPKLDGHEVLVKIKSDPALKLIPVVIFSTSTNETDVVRSYDKYANAYFVKPVDVDEFIRIVHTIEQHWLSAAVAPVQPHI